MRRIVLSCLLWLAAGSAAWANYTVAIGSRASGSETFGPADLICDLNKCRMFNLPAASHLAVDAIVEFGLPSTTGQDRMMMRKCIELCRASVTGVRVAQPSKQESRRPEIYINPSELVIQ